MGIVVCHCSSKFYIFLRMAPVEVETIPVSAVVPEYKFFSKAKELPIVSDATSVMLPLVNEAMASATKLHEQARGNCLYHQVEDVVFEKIREVTPVVPGGVKTTVMSAFDELDNLACSGFDHLTTSIPALTHPTGELVSATTEATISMASEVSDYVASFWIVRAGLKVVDSGLSITEKIVHRMEPERYTKPAIENIRVVRRYLRAMRHAGRRHARASLKAAKTIGQVSMIGWMAELLQINVMLGIFGFHLAPAMLDKKPLATSGKRKLDEGEDATGETLAEKLSDEKMAEYNSSQDPDYEVDGESSVDSLEYRSNADDISQEESTEGDTTQESSQEPDHVEASMPQKEGLRQPAATGILDMVAEKEGLRQPAVNGIHDMATEDVHVETRMEKRDVEASDVDDVLDCIIDACADMDMEIATSCMESLPCTVSSHVHADLSESEAADLSEAF